MSQVSYGTITITDTNDIESIVIEYNKNQDNQNPPSEGDSNWSTNRPAWQQGYYIWQRTRIHKSGTATTADIIGTPVCVTGSTGEQGQPGTAGRSLIGVETKYCIYGTGTPSDSYSGWQDTIPEYNSSTPNYWVKVINTYSSAPTTEIVKYKDTGITNAMAKAADAQSRATTAETNASNALSLSQATRQHFWFNSVKTGNIEAGAYITDVVIDSFKPNKSGNYLLAGSNGIELGNGSHPYMQLTTSELNFFHPNSNNIDAQLSSNGLIVKSGGIEAGTVGQDGGIYLSTKNYGTAHNNQTITINGHEAANWRQIIGTKFGVDSDGVLYAGGANIQGKITVTSGSNVYTTDEVNPLDVGGRNLIISFASIVGSILDSSGELVDNPRGVVSDFIDIEPNTKYILQYWLPEELTDTGKDRAWNCNICWYNQVETTSSATITYVSGYTAEYFDDYVFYAVESPSGVNLCRVCFELPASYQDGVVSENWTNGDDGYRWKLEQGTVATDWTLAPEDTNNIASQQDWYLLTDSGSNYENVDYNYVTEQSGDIISIDDAVLEYPVESLIVDIEPIQNLNGYDHSWVGGAGKNLVRDGQFEDVANAWTNWGSPTTREIVTIDGKKYLHIVSTSGNFQGYSQNETKRNGIGEIVAGETITIQVKVRGASSYNFNVIGVHWRDSSGTIVSQTWKGGSITTTEQTFSVTTTVPENAVAFNVMVGKGSSSTVAELWIRDVQIEKGNSATAYAPWENICPISGRTEVVTQRTGKNLLPYPYTNNSGTANGITYSTTADGRVTISGTATATAWVRLYGGFATDTSLKKPVPSWITADTNYVLSGGQSSNFYVQANLYSGTSSIGQWIDTGSGKSFSLTSEQISNADSFAVFIRVNSGQTVNATISPMIEEGSAKSSWTPYNGTTYTTALGRTVYGGTLDVVSGVLTVDRASYTFDGNSGWSLQGSGRRVANDYLKPTIKLGNTTTGTIGCISDQFVETTPNHTWSDTIGFSIESSGLLTIRQFSTNTMTVADWKAYLAEHPLTIVYPLENPQTYQLTPQQIDLLLGTNHLWSDGEITIKYIAMKLAEWSTVYQLPDQYNPYVWWKYVQTYSSGQIYESVPVIFNSNPQSQLDGLDLQITNQNTIIGSLNTDIQEVNQKYNSIESNQQNIVQELERYNKGVLVDPEIPMVKVFTETEYISHNQTIHEESSVNVYSDIVEIKGNGNTVTEIDSESLKSETIYSTTLLPRVREIVQDYHPTKDREVDTTKTYYTKEEDIYTEVESPTSASLDEYYEYGDVTKLYGKLAFIARRNGHFSIKVISNDERG